MRLAVVVWLHVVIVFLGCVTDASAEDCPAPADTPSLVAQARPLEGEKPARPVKVIPPQFPSNAEAGGVSGLVDFAFTLQPDGSMTDVKVIQEVPVCFGFARAALKVFPQWRFPPKLADGKPIAFSAAYRINFTAARVAPPKAK